VRATRAKPDRALAPSLRIGAVLGTSLRELDRAARRARAGKAAGVHALRIAIRRLRVVVRLGAPVLPSRDVALVVEDLEWLGDVSGALRDLDVLVTALDDLDRGGSPIVERGLAHLRRYVAEVRTAARSALDEALAGPRVSRLKTGLASLAAASTRRNAGELGTAADLVRPSWRKLRRAGRGISKDASPETLHRLRVRVKQVRYGLETVAPKPPKAVAAMGRRLVKLQRLLGTHHDAAAQQSWLQAEVAALASHPEALVAVGVADEWLRRRARRAARAVPKAWARLDRPRLVTAMWRELTERGGIA